MRGRAALAVMVSMVVLVSCSKGSDDTSRKVVIPDKPAGVDGDTFCQKVSRTLVGEAIGEPFQTFDPKVVTDFPAPGVSGYECQWEWQSGSGDVRNLKIDALSYAGALDDALDTSWDGTARALDVLAEPVDGLGEGAYATKLQGLVTVTCRAGDWQVTSVAGAKGSASPATVDVLTLLSASVLKAVE